MVDRSYTQWKTREEDYRSQRRKRSLKTKARGEAKYLWNQARATGTLRFEDYIPRWQRAIVTFISNVRDGMDDDEAWNHHARPSWHSGWAKLDEFFRESLERLADASR